jgi:hypothetical protein
MGEVRKCHEKRSNELYVLLAAAIAAAAEASAVDASLAL